MFRLQPVGRHHVQVCGNLSCWLAGSDQLQARLHQRFGTRPMEPTADGRFSHAEVECLASCGTAPAAVIDEVYYEGLTVERLDAILDKLAAENA
jgi:NADH:ubiquinone oxidoreductase subunit E